MTTWTDEELERIGGEDELEISSLGGDATPGPFTTIWVVRIGGDLYVRPVYGPRSGWFLGTQVRHQGRSRSGGVERDAGFLDVGEADEDLGGRIDEAYRAKYGGRYPDQYVDDCLTAKARSATVKLLPRE